MTDPDDTTFRELFEGALLEDAQLAEDAARLWQYLLTQIERGPEGTTQARHWLEQAIRFTFHFTQTYFLCRELFEASLVEGFDGETPLAVLTALKERSGL